VYPEHLNYRKRDNVAQKLLTPLNAKVNIARFHMQYLIKSIGVKHNELPTFDVSDKNTPIVIARKLKKAWNVNNAIINNVTDLLESKGVIITSFDFGTERVDSRCVLTDDFFPVIIYNNTLLGDRQRFSLAFQLGHLVMHTHKSVDWERDVAHEANLFASELLMPEDVIRGDFNNGITVALLGELKRKWKVSMISLLYRADDLGYLTPNQKRYLLQQFNEQKMRRREPKELDVPTEKEKMVQKWIKELKTKQKLNDKGVASLFRLNIDEYSALYN
jgi:Zn-dependent peptidase ImmA (M78 family)